MLTAKALALWLTILCCAVLNGALREAVLIPSFGEIVGLLSSGVLLSALILVVACIGLPWLRPVRRHQLVGIGLAWVTLSLAFEFGSSRAPAVPSSRRRLLADLLEPAPWPNT